MIVRVEFIQGNKSLEIIDGVERWDIEDGELNLYRRRGTDEEIHLGSFPLVNVRKWQRVPV